MIIDLLGGSYEHRFKDWNSQRTINWYPKITDQKSQEKNKTQLGLFPRSGLTEFVEIAGNSVRGIFTAHTLTQERCFAVVDTNLYEIKYDATAQLIGALTGMSVGSKQRVYMALNGNGELMIQDPLAAYVYNLTTNVLTQITDIDYPNGSTLDYADGYFIISDGEGRVTYSDLNNGLSWSGSSFFTPTYKPDRVKAVVASREEIVCFGDITIEVYINDGETPFIRQSRTSMYYGLTARDSIAVHQAGVFFLGKGQNGGSDVYLLGNDYSLNPISTPAIANRLNQATNEDAEGFIYCTTDGHIFYMLHLPALKTTLVYDLSTGMWHERSSIRPFADSDGTYPNDIYRARNHVRFRGKNLFGDWWSGKIFIESGYTDDGYNRILRRTSPIFHNELKNVSVYGLEFDMNSGSADVNTSPVLILKYSKDGGNTYEAEELISLGTTGEYEYRIKTNSLGTARNWTIDFSVADPVDVIVTQAVANGVFGVY